MIGSCSSFVRKSMNFEYTLFTEKLFRAKHWTIWTSLPMYTHPHDFDLHFELLGVNL